MYWSKLLEHSVVFSPRLITAQCAAGGSIFLFFFFFHYLQSWNDLAAGIPQYHISTEGQPDFKSDPAGHKMLGFLEKEQ